MICWIHGCRQSDSHPGRCKMISHCGFHLHFVMNNNAENLFVCPLAIYTCSWEKYLFSFSEIGVYAFFFKLSCMSYLYILDIIFSHSVNWLLKIYIISCHLQTVTVLLLSFQFGFMLFLLLLWLLCLGIPVIYWKKVAIGRIFDALLILEEKFSAFQHWIWCQLWIVIYDPY